jgi:molybdopterin/thiamine biosynthesis adenylyltransferase
MIEQNVKELVLTKSTAKRCIDYFRKNLPEESLVFVFGKTIEKRDGTIAIANNPIFPENSDYVSKSRTDCEVSLDFMAREFPKHFKKDEKLILSWHCHPIDCLSGTDEETHLETSKGYKNILTGYYNDGRFEFFQYDGSFRRVTHRVVDMKFYDRQIRAFGLDAQHKLITTHVALIGCGGAAQLAYLLAEEGIGKLTLIDSDSWDKTSLNRVWIPRSHVGKNKAESLMKLIKRWRSTEVRAFPCVVEDLPKGALEDVDIMVAMTDTFKSRIEVNRLAIDLKKPAIIAGAEIRAKENKIEYMVGECIVYLPNETPCYECNAEIDPKQAMKEVMDKKSWRRFAIKYGLPPDSAPVPSLANLNNIIVSLISDEIMKIVTGCAKPIHYQYWDHLGRRLVIVKAERNSECRACGEIKQAELKQSDLISTEEALSKGVKD